ncbi:MAG TPA: O-antigen ligase family protein [Thermoanaerobaculia bacterium]|nr:O-antigen ligase family protein [Thermoanaerobaculia bacterium]
MKTISSPTPPTPDSRHPTPAIVWAELFLVLLLAPLLAFPPLGHPWLLLLPFLLPVLWLIKAPPVTPLNGSLLLLLAAVLLSLAASFDIAYSTSKVLGVVLGVAVFFAVVRVLSSSGALDIAIETYAAAGGALAAIGVLGTNWIGKVGALQSLAARMPAVIRGVPGQQEGFQPNAIAGALLFFIPLQLALAVSGRRRILAVLLLLFTSGVFLLTQSRNAWLGLAVAMAAWAIWQSRGRLRLAVIGIVVVAILGGAAFWTYGNSRLSERVVGGGLSSDVESRVELWSRAIYMIEDFPFTGVGMNDFRRVMPVMYPALFTPPETDIAHAHNQLLNTGAELGIPGLVAYIAILLGAAAMLVRTFRTTSDARLRWIAAGLGAGFLAFFGFGMADAIALGAKLGIVFWAALALVVAVDARNREALS